MRHLFASIDYFPIYRQPPTYSMDILFYSIFSRTWSFMSLVFFRAPQGFLTWFWQHGSCLNRIFTQRFSPFVISPCGSANTHLTTTPVLIPLSILIIQIIIIHYIHFEFVVKIFFKIIIQSKINKLTVIMFDFHLCSYEISWMYIKLLWSFKMMELIVQSLE